jgi:hypothetical protein
MHGLLVDPERMGAADDGGLVNREGEKEVRVQVEHFRIQSQGASNGDCMERLR